MDATRRMKLIRIVNKIEENKSYANKIGTTNKSELRTAKQ